MKTTIHTAAEIGPVIRAVRKSSGLRQDDAAGSLGVSENFLGKIERGGHSLRWDKLFEVLTGLGIRVVLDIPDPAQPPLAATRGKPVKRA
ncbi:MAG: helix-turn-helix domain-containing protein [Pseudomonadota bacterium]